MFRIQKLAPFFLLLLAVAAVAIPPPQHTSKPVRPLCVAKVDRGLKQVSSSVYLEKDAVTMRDTAGGVLLTIPDAALVDVAGKRRGSQLPFVPMSQALGSSTGLWDGLFAFGSVVAWDAGVGISRLFRKPKHSVTITYNVDGEEKYETLQLSARDAAKLVDALNARRARVANPTP